MRLVPVDYKWIYDQCLFDYAKQLEMHVFVCFVDSSFLEKETKKTHLCNHFRQTLPDKSTPIKALCIVQKMVN